MIATGEIANPVATENLSLPVRWNLRRAFPLVDRVEAIDAGQIHVFDRPVGPMDFRIVDLRAVPQPKMNAEVVRGGIAASANHIPPLLDPASDIVGPLGRDIPASVRDWALTSEPRRAREAGPPAWILEELRRFNDAAGC